MLAVNTAFMTANLALKIGENVLLRDIDAKSKHSENVLKTIDEMCQEMDVDILNVGTVAVVTGPGSFTGLRIGVSIAKALGCVNKQLKFVSLSSLELMAYIIAQKKLNDGEFVCAINALSGLFFVAKFDKNGIKLEDERMIDKEALLALKAPIFALKDDMSANGHYEIEIACEDVLNFACLKEEEHKFVDIDDLLPLYLRLSQAEDNLLAKNVKKQ